MIFNDRAKINTTPIISVIIPFHGNIKDLSNCLNGLRNQKSAYPFEVIIVESGNNLEVKKLIDLNSEVTFISSDKVLFPGKARNIGVANSRSDLLAFIDADCVPSETWISGIHSSLRNGYEIIIGPIINLYPFHPVASIDNLMTFPDFQSRSSFKQIPYFAACNFGIRKKLFSEVKGFPEELEIGEDTKFSQSAIGKCKGKIFYDSKTLVFHAGRKNIFKFMEHQKKFGCHKKYSAGNNNENKLHGTLLYSPLFGLRKLAYISFSTLQLNPAGLIREIIYFPILAIGLIAWVKGFWETNKSPLEECKSNGSIKINSKDSRILRIGLIGCGRAAEIIYSRALNKFPYVKVALVDPIKERRELLSLKFGNCFVCDSIWAGDFFNQIDAGIIATPPDTHIPIASEFLKNNKYILVEKPLSISMKGIKELIEIESASEGSLMMGFNFRYWEPAISLKKKLLQNSKIKSVQMDFMSNYEQWDPISFISGPLDDLGPHLFDLIGFILNDRISSVSSEVLSDKNLNLKVKTSKGISVNCHLAHTKKSEISIKVTAQEEKFFITSNSTRVLSEDGIIREIIDFNDQLKRKLLRKPSPIRSAYEIQLANFFDFVRYNKPANPDIKIGINAILAVDAARSSINNFGKEIFINENI